MRRCWRNGKTLVPSSAYRIFAAFPQTRRSVRTMRNSWRKGQQPSFRSDFDDAAVVHPYRQNVHFRLIIACSVDNSRWGCSPWRCQSMQPWTAHARIPGSSAVGLASISGSLRAGPSSVKVTVNGISRIRRQMAWSVPRISGLWFVDSHSL